MPGIVLARRLLFRKVSGKQQTKQNYCSLNDACAEEIGRISEIGQRVVDLKRRTKAVNERLKSSHAFIAQQRNAVHSQACQNVENGHGVESVND